MPSDLDIEILTIDDSVPSVQTNLKKPKNPLKKKWRTVRKSTGVGGKAPHSVIPFKPLRKTVSVKPPTPRKTRNVNPEYFDVEDDDSDDDIQVIENDPLNDVEVLSDGASEGFCDMCGLYLENTKDMEAHYETVHKLVTCKWCQTRLGTNEIKNHIKAQFCPNFTKLLGSHCSVHNEIETDDKLEMDGFKNCRPLRCDSCSQRYDSKSLRDFDEQSKCYVCPGCLHGRISTSAKVDQEVSEVVSLASEPVTPSRPVPQFLSTPNPIPLPEILLLDNDQEEVIKESQAISATNNEDDEKDDSTAEGVDTNLDKSEVKKKSSLSLTSKLVEMINTQIQDKVVIETEEKSPIVDVVEIRTICPEKQETISHETDEDVVCLETKPEGRAEDEVVKSETRTDEEEEAEVANPVASTEVEHEVVDKEPPMEIDVVEVIEVVKSNGIEVSINEVENEVSTPIVSSHDVEKACSQSENLVQNDVNVSTTDSSARTELSSFKSSSPAPATVAVVPASPTTTTVSTPARRVARKSTKPPQNPQRLSESMSELLLFETLNEVAVCTPSPKRKLVSPTLSARKVARKSTRPPRDPQRTLFNEETVEVKQVSSDCSTEVTCLDNEMESALLLATPTKGYINVMDELEVLDELVC